MLEESKYEDYWNHRRIHNTFLDWLNTINVPVSDENIDMAKEW